MISSLGADWAWNAASTTVSGLKKSAILYHYPCPDGAFAALAAHIYFSATPSTSALFFPNRVYSPVKPHQLPLHEIDELYLLDYVGPSGFVQEVSSQVNRYSFQYLSPFPFQCVFLILWDSFFCFLSGTEG